MLSRFWLITTNKGKVRTTVNQPDLKWDEVAIKINLELPDMMFRRPTVSANIKIDHNPQVDIDAETVNNIEQVLKQEGINVKLTIEPQEEKP